MTVVCRRKGFGFAVAALTCLGTLSIGCRVTTPAVVAPPVVQLPAPTPTAVPTAAATPPPIVLPRPTAVPTVAQQERPSSLQLLPQRPIRVLLAEAGDVVLPDPGRRYRCTSGTKSVVLRGPLEARQEAVQLGIQTGAFASQANATGEVSRLRSVGLDAVLRSDGTNLFRVVVLGRDGEVAETLRDRLVGAGVPAPGRAVAMGGRLSLTGEGGQRLSGASLEILPLDEDPVRFGDRRFRGSFLIAPAPGGLRLVNVLPLETYLRGVVPAEMGPRAFPALEALKAQAVAARTYVIAHLGERAADGYDICATQACQVYEGVGVEHPLSDRAIRETVGEILLWQGRPIDAMYHSTCAGHTEDAAAVLPERAAPYLVGVPCRGEAALHVGAGPQGAWLGPLGRLDVVAREMAARLELGEPTAAGLATRLTGRPAQASAVGLVWSYGLADALGMLHGTEGESDEELLLRLLDTYRTPLAPRREEQSEEEWLLAVSLRLAQLAGHVEAVEGRLVASPNGLRLVVEKGDSFRNISGSEKVLERRGESWRAGPVVFHAGSSATLWCLADGPCAVLEVEPRTEADDRSAWGWWVREVPLRDIASRLRLSDVAGVTVLERGRSGRATTVAVASGAGVTRVEGYRFRMSLGLPDTLFVVSVRPTPSGPVAHFVGRGWGHGIGMCQNGAYGLAQGGADHTEILATYYTGAVLAGPDGKTGGANE